MQYHSNIDIWWVFQFINWVYTIVNHCLVSMAVQLPSYLFRTGYEGNCMVCRPNWYKKQNAIKYPCPPGIKKCEILIIDNRMVSKEDKLISMNNILHWCIEDQTHFGMPRGAKMSVALTELK